MIFSLFSSLALCSTYDVLSKHEATARFDGIKFHPCRFMTSLCPDRCNHAKNLSEFTIINYKVYEKVGEYGDEKQERFYADINPNAAESRQSAEVVTFIKNLKPGVIVKLAWEHRYVKTEEGSMYPERIITSIESEWIDIPFKHTNIDFFKQNDYFHSYLLRLFKILVTILNDWKHLAGKRRKRLPL